MLPRQWPPKMIRLSRGVPHGWAFRGHCIFRKAQNNRIKLRKYQGTIEALVSVDKNGQPLNWSAIFFFMYPVIYPTAGQRELHNKNNNSLFY